MMDIKRSDRLRKTAAIAALVLAINSTGATAELGTTGFFDGDVVSAITISSTDFEIKSEADLQSFINQDTKKRGIINVDNLEVTECLGDLTGEKVLYGNGKTIIIKGTDGTASPLFNEIESGSRIENVNIKTAPSVHVESDTTVGAVCKVNNGELRYVTVDAVVYSVFNTKIGYSKFKKTLKVDDIINTNFPSTGIVCGENNGTIFGCIASGILDTRNYCAGSICGKNTSNIERCSCSVDIRFSSNGKECLDYKGDTYTGTFDSYIIGGLCGVNLGEMYDCIFEGWLPHYDWTLTEYGNNRTTYSKKIASEYRGRNIGAYSGYLGTNAHIRNSLYNGRINLSKADYNFIKDITEDNQIVKDYFCNGNFDDVDDRMSNSYRLDTYFYEDNVKTCHGHYHKEDYTNDNTKLAANEFSAKAENNKVLKNLNDGTKDSRPTPELRDGDVWIINIGDLYPRLNLMKSSTVADVKANSRYYDGTEQPLVKDASVGKGFGTILYRLGETGDWSEEIPKATAASEKENPYRVYYKVEAGPGYKDSDVKYVDVEIKPRKLKIKDVEVPYTGKPHTITPEIDNEYVSTEEPDGYGLVDGETCEMTDIHFMQGGEDKEVKDKGEYTITAKPLENNNYVFEDGKVRVTDSAAVSIAAPSASDITYGQTLSESNLSAISEDEKIFAGVDGKWKWADEKADTYIPNATQNSAPESFKARLKVDGNFNYDLKNGTFKIETANDGSVYLVTSVPVQVDKRPIIIEWDNTKEYEYTGKPIVPKATHKKCNNVDNTGYISEDDEKAYTYGVIVTPSPAVNIYDNYTATVAFNYTDKSLHENYELSFEPKSFSIIKGELSYFGDVETSVKYGETSKPVNINKVFEGMLKEQLEEWNKAHPNDVQRKFEEFSFDRDFAIDGHNSEEPLDVSSTPYTITVNYSYRASTGGMDNGFGGSFKEKVTVTPVKGSIDIAGTTNVYDGRPHELIDIKKAEGIDIISYKVTDKFGNATETSTLPTSTDVIDCTITYTFKPNGNHYFDPEGYTDNGDGTYSSRVNSAVTPKPIDAHWNTDKHEFEWGTPVDISAYLEDGDVFERDFKEGKKPALITANGNGKDVDEYEATASIDKSTFKYENYELKNNSYKYRIIKSKKLPAIPTPSAGPITYGQTYHDAELTEGWAVPGTPGTDPLPNAGDHKGIEVHHPVDDEHFDYNDENTPNYVPGQNPGEGYIKENVDIVVNPKELTVDWEDKDKFEYNGNVQIPAIVKVHGYIDEPEVDGEYSESTSSDAERNKYPVIPELAKGNGKDVGNHTAIPVIHATKNEDGTDRPKNYFIDSDGETYYKNYEIIQVGINDIKDVNVTLEYEEATLEKAQEKLLAQLTANLAAEGKNIKDYEFTGKFTATVNNEKKLDANKTYSSVITYTYKGDKTDNISGSFKENVTVNPSEVTVKVTPRNWVYDGEYNPLVDVEQTGPSTVLYTVTKSGESVDYIFQSSPNEIPEAVNAGTYTVSYTVTTDSNHVFKGETKPVTSTVSPKPVEVKWESNAEYNKDTNKNEIHLGTEPKVRPFFAEGVLHENEDGDQPEWTVTPDGSGVDNYTVTAIYNNENYTITNNVYEYSIVDDIKITDELTATYGDPVSSVKLPETKEGKFEWKNPDEPVGPVGKQDHLVVFTPDDGSNYKKTEITVPVLVYPKDVHLIWNIDNGHKFTFNREEQKVTVRPDLKDVYDYDEKAFAATRVADDLVNAGDHKAVASINNSNYQIVKGTESRTYTILPSDELQPLNYSETYEYGTTAKEIFDDLFEKHFNDFSDLAINYSVDPDSVVVYKNGTKINTEKLQNYAKSCIKAQDLIYNGDIEAELNKLGKSFYNKPDFDIAKNYKDYFQIKNLVDSNKERIKHFIDAGVLPKEDKYKKLITLFEKYEAVKEAEDVMQEVGDYKITVSYNHMADKEEQSLERFKRLSGNYNPKMLTAEIKITPCVIENLFADIDSREYNGGKNVDVNGFTFISKKNGKDKEWTLGGFDASGTEFVSADAGTKTINTEMTLRNENFCFGYDKSGKPVMTKKFNDVATDGEIYKAEWKYTVNLEGFAGDRLSSLVVPGIVHGTFSWNDTKTVIAEGPNVIDASEYTFTPDKNDRFNKNYDVVLTVNVNGVKKPVETIVETQTVVETQIVTAVETVIVTDETKPAETTVNSGDVTTDNGETSKATEPAVTDVTADETKASDSVSEKAVTTASTEASGAVTTASTDSTKQSVTEATTDGSAKTTDLPEITLPASTTDKLMGEVTDVKVIVTKPSETEAAKAETTAKTEDDKKAVTTAKSDDDKKAVTTAATEETKAAETTVSTATVTLPDTNAVTTAAAESTKPSDTTAKTDDNKKAVTTAATEETKAAETTVSTATVTLPDTNAVTTAAAESTKPSDTTAKTDDNKKAVTTAGDVTTAETTVSTAGATTPVSESAKPAETEATKAATTAKVEDTTTAEATAETTVTTVSDTKAEETTAATTAATEETKTAEPSVTAADVTTEVTTAEVTEAATLPTLPEITMPVVTTDKLMGDVTDAVVTEAVTTPAVTEKADLEKIREIIINEPERVNDEVLEDEKISIKGDEIKLDLEDKMFFQGTESFDYPVKLKDFNAEKAYFDYAGFGFELPEGFTIDPASVSTDLKGNIRFYAPDSVQALALEMKTGYKANGGYVVFRGVETRNLDPDATLFTVKVKVADTLNVCVSRIGVSALYGRLTENSKFVEDNKVEPHIALLDNGAGEQLYTKTDSSVRMGVKGDVNLDGRVSQVDATIVLREILSLEVFKKSLLAENIDHHDGTADEAVALSHFLGNVNQSPNGLFTQIDATSILRGILERDINNTGIVTEEIWKKVTNK